MKKIGIIILLLMVVSGCKKTEEITMIVPYGSPQLAQLYMQNDEAYKVDIVIGADPLVAAFGSSSHDVIFAPTNLGAKMYQSKETYQLLATVIWGNYYLVTNRTDIHHIEDLEGEEITVFGQNQTSDIVIRHILDFHEITCQMNYVDSVTTASSIYIADTSKIVLVADPAYSNLKHLYPAINTIDIQQEYQITTGNALFPQASVFIKSTLSEEQVTKIENDLKKSIEDANQYLEQTAQLAISLGVDMDIDVLSNSIASGYIEYVSAMDAKSDIITYFELILDSNPILIGSTLPSNSFYRGDQE